MLNSGYHPKAAHIDQGLGSGARNCLNPVLDVVEDPEHLRNQKVQAEVAIGWSKNKVSLFRKDRPTLSGTTSKSASRPTQTIRKNRNIFVGRTSRCALSCSWQGTGSVGTGRLFHIVI